MEYQKEKPTYGPAMCGEEIIAANLLRRAATIDPQEDPKEYFAKNNEKFSHYASLPQNLYEGTVLGQDSPISDRQMVDEHASSLGLENTLLNGLLLELTYNHMPKSRQNIEDSVYTS